jgi:hypothetical protein
MHALENDAYELVAKAFYGQGPLTWKKESVLRELRSVLHISEEKHQSLVKEWVESGMYVSFFFFLSFDLRNRLSLVSYFDIFD